MSVLNIVRDNMLNQVSNEDAIAYQRSISRYESCVYMHTNHLAYVRVADLASIFQTMPFELIDNIKDSIPAFSNHLKYAMSDGRFLIGSEGEPSDWALTPVGFEELARCMKWNINYSRVVNDIVSAMKLKAYNSCVGDELVWLRDIVYDSRQLHSYLPKKLCQEMLKLTSIPIQGVEITLAKENHNVQVEILNRIEDLVYGDLIRHVHLRGLKVPIYGRAELWYRGKEDGSSNKQMVKFTIPETAYKLEFDGLNYQLTLDVEKIIWGE